MNDVELINVKILKIIFKILNNFGLRFGFTFDISLNNHYRPTIK